MARKPRSEWTEAYRRRVERAEEKLRAEKRAQGKAGRLTAKEREAARQRARGHKAGEHKIRAAREQERKETLGELTSKDKAYVRRFAREQARQKQGVDIDKATKRLLDIARVNGMDVIRELRSARNQRRAQIRGERRRGTYESRGMRYITDLMAEYGFDEPDDDIWFFYH